MIALDAYALVALLADEPAAAEVEELLRRGGIGVSAVNLAEAIDVLVRVHSIPGDDALAAVEPLLDGAIDVLPATREQAVRAAELRSHHYERNERPLSLADCFLLAAAGEAVATADPVVATVARS